MTTRSTIPLDDLARPLRGAVHRPGTPDYARLSAAWNLTVARAPLAVIAVADVADVVAVVRFAGTHGLDVAVQCTGHGAEPADLSRTLLVHTGGLDELTVHPEGWARVGAGVEWNPVVEAAAEHGLAPLCGSAPAVGVVGYVTGGGLGPVSRTYGLSSESVRAFDLVTGDGEVRRASAGENPDLFWGLRGGKGALGIVTAVEVELMPVREIYGGAAFFGPDDVPAVVRCWARWSEQLPDAATTSLAVLRLPPVPGVPEPLAGRCTVAVRFAWVGDPAEGERCVAPVLSTAPAVLGGFRVMPYAEIGSIHADPVDPMPVHDSFVLLAALPEPAVDALLAVAGPGADCPQSVVELRRLGGAIARPPAVPSAFTYRDDAVTLFTSGSGAPPAVAATSASAEVIAAAMAPWTSPHSMPNFDRSEDPADVLRRYGADTVTRLAGLAARYDPMGVLRDAAPVRAAARLLR